MSANNFNDLLKHAGHHIDCVVYTDKGLVNPKHNRTTEPPSEVYKVAIECYNCFEIILDYDNPNSGYPTP